MKVEREIESGEREKKKQGVRWGERGERGRGRERERERERGRERR